MSCQEKQVKFDTALAQISDSLQAEMVKIAATAQEQSEQLNDEFEANNETAENVGTAAGTVIGGYLGGAGGAVAGAKIGEFIGSLFTMEIRSEDVRVVLDVPQVTMKDKEISFDLPEVTMKDNDIIFHLPTLVMKRQRGPDIPECTVRMKTKCISVFGKKICTDIPETVCTMKATYLDLPTWENREQRIVLGIPEVVMVRRTAVVGLPEIRMDEQEFIFSVPSITIKFVKDAGEKLSEAAKRLADETTEQAQQKKLGLKARIVAEVSPLAAEMFDCYRQEIGQARLDAVGRYEPEITKITDTLKQMVANSVPESDDDFVAQKAKLDDVLAKRKALEDQFDSAIAELNKSAEETIASLINLGS